MLSIIKRVGYERNGPIFAGIYEKLAGMENAKMNNRLFNKSMMLSLNQRFQDLSSRCMIPDSAFDSEFVCLDLLRRYNKPGRYYHDLNHLVHCLNQFDLVSQTIPDADAVEMALWFHDAIYIPGSADNEKRSTELFLQKANNCCSHQFKSKVKNLILVTSHKYQPNDDDECFIVDIDLSSFGLGWSDFLVDTGNLRREQFELPDPAYFESHTRFLNMLLARDRIFYTDFFYLRYEQIALQNINRLLATRKSQGYA